MSKNNIAKITDAPDYGRDMESGAVILTNKKPLDKYMLEKQRRLDDKRKISSLESEVESLRKEIEDISVLVYDLKKYCEDHNKDFIK